MIKKQIVEFIRNYFEQVYSRRMNDEISNVFDRIHSCASYYQANPLSKHVAIINVLHQVLSQIERKKKKKKKKKGQEKIIPVRMNESSTLNFLNIIPGKGVFCLDLWQGSSSQMSLQRDEIYNCDERIYIFISTLRYYLFKDELIIKGEF